MANAKNVKVPDELREIMLGREPDAWHVAQWLENFIEANGGKVDCSQPVDDKFGDEDEHSGRRKAHFMVFSFPNSDRDYRVRIIACDND